MNEINENKKISKPADVKYTRNDLRYAAGKITVVPDCNSKNQNGYIAFFGDENGIFADYTEAARFFAGEYEKTIADCTVLPKGTSKLYVYGYDGENLSEQPFISDINGDNSQYENPLWKFWVITDLHVSAEEETEDNKDKAYQNENNRLTFRDISDVIGKDSVENKAVITVGDNIDNGRENQWINLCKIINDNLSVNVPVRFTLGNHELGIKDYPKTRDMFMRYTNSPNTYYEEKIGGIPFIHLASASADDARLDIGQDEQAWLEGLLREASDEHKPVFCFLHTPLLDTVSGSLKTLANQTWGGHLIQNDGVRSIFSRYPNVILFSGHTHWKFDSLIPVVDGKGKDASFVNCASCGYLWNDNDKWNSGSEGMCIEVYRERIILRGREFQKKKWIAYAQFELGLFNSIQ